MKFGSLFSGIGGLDLGLERAGMQCQWQVEIDDYATKVLERHWPNVKRWRDIADFITDANSPRFENAKREQSMRIASGFSKSKNSVDLICGGFPCQPVSVAGSRAGENDSRWLWDSFCEVLRIIRPRYWADCFEEYCETFPRSGMMRNGILYQQPPLVRRISETESSLLPTATSRDWKSGQASPATHERNSRPLSEQIGGLLNPQFAEAIMGFPIGWTNLDALEIQLSPKSQNGSETE